MKKTLYNSDISPKCKYCKVGIPTSDGNEILCKRMGVMQAESYCKKFKYDPLKRKPQIASLLSDFSEDDFKL